ncbi:dynein regulatory complex protein 1-like [Notolabrus celidotus]|uniref:dynein regulatory complex protein 1-like n=1 Tax=Notolabrus celidotus TaxID=1203425 RepID=UPI00148FFD85|nr:dynein regulatory complex protein 1-like [Notolabrus celidotus]
MEEVENDLKKNTGELGLMMERVEDQIKTLKQAYREELASFERIYQQESDILLTTDKTEWEHRLNELWDKELARLTLRQREVEDSEEKVRDLLFQTLNHFNKYQLENNEQSMVLKRDSQSFKASSRVTKMKEGKKKLMETVNLAPMKNRLLSLKTELKNLKVQCSSQVKQFTERSRQLSDRFKHNIKEYEHTQRKIQHFAVADGKQFEQMWLMVEDEVKQLVKEVMLLDSLICKQHLGLAWERPHMALMEQTGPIQPQKEAPSPAQPAVSTSFHTMQASQGRQRMMDASVGPTLETYTNTGVHKEDAAGQSEGGVAVEEGKLSNETVKKVMKLLCDEAGFLLEGKLLSLLGPLEEEEQTVVKLGPLLFVLGIEKEDVPRLAHFLLKYKNQQREQTEDVCVESGEYGDKEEEVGTCSSSHVTSELIDPNHILPALNSFLKQHVRSREVSAHHLSFQYEAVRDTSEDEAYWESMGNIISEDKVKVWEAAENKIKQYHAKLTEVSELVTETQGLEQQNTELRRLLQQHHL